MSDALPITCSYTWYDKWHVGSVYFLSHQLRERLDVEADHWEADHSDHYQSSHRYMSTSWTPLRVQENLESFVSMVLP